MEAFVVFERWKLMLGKNVLCDQHHYINTEQRRPADLPAVLVGHTWEGDLGYHRDSS